MSGIIYCFNTICNARIYKAGHTQQEDLASRLKGYLGPSKPRVIVAHRRADDSLDAEDTMLRLLRLCHFFRTRPDLGDEWFEATDGYDEDARHKAVCFILDVASKASRTIPRVDESTHLHPAPQVPLENASMASYFLCLDRFVEQAPPDAFTDTDALMQAFEESDMCPVFAEYVLWPRPTRLSLVRTRYQHLNPG